MHHLGTCDIETSRLLLRKHGDTDLDSSFRNWAGREEVFRLISQVPMSRQDVEIFLAGAEEAYADPSVYRWAIEEKSSGEVMGEVFVDDFSSRNGWCELDYRIGPDYWGRGYTTEAVRAVLCYLLGQVGFHRVQAKCSVENVGSRRVMEKAGLRQEGVLRSFFQRKDGTGYDDVVLCAILVEELPFCQDQEQTVGTSV